ncbi:hypothetical protein ACLBR5_03875 [Escherichia coli]
MSAVATMQLVQLVWEWLMHHQAMLSLGTSGVYFAVSEGFLSQKALYTAFAMRYRSVGI